MLLLSLRHSEAKESNQIMIYEMNDHDPWIQVLARTEETLYFWAGLEILTVANHCMK